MLADDLLLDRVGARLDADDELGSLLLAVAHRADTPIPRATLARRVRPHRGLTVLAALGVAVSGATVAAAVELGPVPPDQASGVPHARAFLPPSLQALVLPFLSGSPFQGRLVLPFGALPGVPLDGSVTALGLPATALPSAGQLMEPLSVATQEARLDKQEHEDQQDAQRQKVQAKGTPATGQGQTPTPAMTTSGWDDDQGAQPVEAPPKAKPTPTNTPATGARDEPCERPGQRSHQQSGQRRRQRPGQRRRQRPGHPTAAARPALPPPHRPPVTPARAAPTTTRPRARPRRARGRTRPRTRPRTRTRTRRSPEHPSSRRRAQAPASAALRRPRPPPERPLTAP